MQNVNSMLSPFSVEIVHTGYEAQARATAPQPKLVFQQYRITDKSGFDLTVDSMSEVHAVVNHELAMRAAREAIKGAKEALLIGQYCECTADGSFICGKCSDDLLT